MRKIALIAAIAVLALAVSAGWQIASCELADRQLEEALRDIASRNAEHIGLSAPTTDDGLRNSVIRAAKELGIVLDPKQVTVQHSGEGKSSAVHLSADYTAHVRLLGLGLTLHFTPTSDRPPS
jgi:ABC-type sugar transport system substrate-binding protein